mgnify:CR=1 FL=1
MEDFKKILAKIAENNGTTPEEVRRDMQAAIDAAFDNHDASAQPLWDMMIFEGKRPTPEEFILRVAMMIYGGNGITN